MTARVLDAVVGRVTFELALWFAFVTGVGAALMGDASLTAQVAVCCWGALALRRRLRPLSRRGRPPLRRDYGSTLDLASGAALGVHLGEGTRQQPVQGVARAVAQAFDGPRTRSVTIPLVLEPELLRQHALILGSSGTGKTNALAGLIQGLDEIGVGQVIIDLKGDPALVDFVRRQHPGARVFALEGADCWDPLAFGDAGAHRDMLMDLEDWTEPHYERAARRFLGTLLGALHATQRPTLEVLQHYLESPEQANEIIGACRQGGAPREADALERALDLIRGDRTLRGGVIGLGNRLAIAADSPTSNDRLRADPAAVDLDVALRHRGVVIFSLPATRYPFEARAIGSLALSACLIRAAEHDAAGRHMRAQVIVDEAAQLLGPQLIRAERLGRSLGLGIVFATQALNDLHVIEVAEALWESTALKLIFRQDVPDAAEWIAKSIGTETVKRSTVQYERQFMFRVRSGLESERDVEEWTVNPNAIRRLTTGQAVAIRRWPQTETTTVKVNAYL